MAEASASYAAELDFYRGLAHRDRHEPDAALQALGRAAAAAPGDARFSFELANELERAGRIDEAVRAWRRAADDDPEDLRPRRRVALRLAQSHDLDGAIAELRLNLRAPHRSPSELADEQLSIGLLLARTGASAAALDELRAAHAADPGYLRSRLSGACETLRADPAVHDPAFWSGLAALALQLGEPGVAATRTPTCRVAGQI